MHRDNFTMPLTKIAKVSTSVEKTGVRSMTIEGSDKNRCNSTGEKRVLLGPAHLTTNYSGCLLN
jgi:hypothetical protein